MKSRQKTKSLEHSHFRKVAYLIGLINKQPYEYPHKPKQLNENDHAFCSAPQNVLKTTSSRRKLKEYAYKGEGIMGSSSAPVLKGPPKDDQRMAGDAIGPFRDEESKANDFKFPKTPAHYRYPLSQLVKGRSPQEDRMIIDPSPDRVIWRPSPGDLICGRDAEMIELLRKGQKLPSSPHPLSRIRPVLLQDNSSPDSKDPWKTCTVSCPLPTSKAPFSLSESYSPIIQPLPKTKRRRVCSNSEPFLRDPQHSRLSALVRRVQKEYGQSKSAVASYYTQKAQESPGKDFGNDFDDLDAEALDMLEMNATQALRAQTSQQSPFVQGKKSRSPNKHFCRGSSELPSSPLRNKAKSQKSIIKEEEEEDYGGEELDEELQMLDVGMTDTGQFALVNPPESIDQANDLMEDLRDFDWDNFEQLDLKRSLLARYLILQVQKGYDESAMYMQKILRVKNEKFEVEKTVYLREDWVELDARPGDIIHLVGHFSTPESFIVDNSGNFVILSPDTLISSTVVADSYGCIRRAVLQDRVKATGDISKSMVFGSVLHELYQEAMQANNFSADYMTSVVNKLVKLHIQQLYVLGLNPQTVKDELDGKVKLLQKWADRFVRHEPGDMAFVAEHRGSSHLKPTMCINNILDIEEHIWSPTYGLKGNIDVTIQMKLCRPGQPAQTVIAPLEFKTGRNSRVLHHRAQTILYALMMTDRYDIDILNGLLYYMETEETILVPALKDEIRGLILGRNELARYISDRATLPPMLKDLRTCKTCYAAETCLTYHKALEDGTTESSGLFGWFNEKTSHITTLDSQFFKHWDNLLTKEESDMFRFQKELWTITSSERENLGRCFSDLTIEAFDLSELDACGSKINRYRYKFKKHLATLEQSIKFSFLNSQISLGEPIVVSDELGHFALANGFVVDLRPEFIVVAVDRRLRCVSSLLPDKVTGTGQPLTSNDQQMRYRIDRDEFKNGMAFVRNNLIQLMNGPERRRRLLINYASPEFSSKTPRIPGNLQEGLNIDQKRAIEKVLSAKDYALILGMPGTGKTTTITCMIQSLVAMGKSVLVASYTHTAVDNILLKLEIPGEKILRLGASDKIHHDVKTFAILGDMNVSTFEELEESFLVPKVVATTCLALNHLIFTKRMFDYCIIDEASQIPLPVSLGPLRYSKTFVLVGDHFQLPPLVRNSEAQKGGLDVSLFKLLCEIHPQSVVSLEHQYRMNKEIMALSNRLIYAGKLKIGDEKLANKTLEIPNIENLTFLHDSSVNPCLNRHCWLKDLLDEAKKVVFVDTDDVPALEERKGDRIINFTEAQLTVEALTTCGVQNKDIGVISVYRSQLKIISHMLENFTRVEINTADKYQGRDKECIVISFVRSNSKQNVGDLLRDWRRINVAFTRAKSKLIIFGSKSTLSSNCLLNEFLQMIHENGWAYKLEYSAHLIHVSSRLSLVALASQETCKRKRIRGEIVLKDRPVLREIANEIGNFKCSSL